MFPPELLPDEHHILSGGFGGNAWIYTGVLIVGLAPTILLTPLGLWFWLRSSRFVLTDQRLIVKPRFGMPRELTVDQLQGAAVTIGTAGDSVYLDGPVTVRLRYQRQHERVWGALLVMCGWPLPKPSPLRGAGCDWSSTATRRGSEVHQAGVAVISGRKLVFVPFNSGLRKGGVGKTAALAVVGLREVTARARFPVLELISALLARGGDFSSHLTALAQALGGLSWTISQTQRRASKHGFTVSVDDEHLDIPVNKDSALIIAALTQV